jgi:hypothetical protein
VTGLFCGLKGGRDIYQKEFEDTKGVIRISIIILKSKIYFPIYNEYKWGIGKMHATFHDRFSLKKNPKTFKK